MAEFKLKGNVFHTAGDLPAVGADAPAVTLVGSDLGDLDLLFSLMAYPGFTESGRWRTDTKFDIKYEFPMDFFIKMGFSLNYDNQPAADASTTDYVFNVSVGWDW